jgi:WD40 repeat protein
MTMRILSVVTLILVLISRAILADDQLRLVAQLGHVDEVKAIAVSADGSILATGSKDHTIRVWDAATGRELRDLALRDTENIASVSLSPDGQTVMAVIAPATPTSSRGEGLRVWDVGTGQEQSTQQFLTRSLIAAGFSNDGRSIDTVEIDADRTRAVDTVAVQGELIIRRWDANALGSAGALQRRATSEERFTLTTEIDVRPRVALTADFVAASRLEDVTVLSRKMGAEVFTVNCKTAVTSLAFSVRGRHLAVGCARELRLIDVSSGKTERIFAGHTEPIYSIAFSSDDSTIVTGAADRTAKLWDVQTGRDIGTLQGSVGIVWAVSFRPGHDELFTASADKTTRLWDVTTKKEVRRFAASTSRITSMSFSLDGRRLLFRDAESIQVWDLSAARVVNKWNIATDAGEPAVFSADANRIVIGRRDGSLELWNVINGRVVARLKGHAQRVNSVAAVRNSQRIVSGSDDRTARVWDIATGKQIHRLAHDGPVTMVAFAADGDQIVTAHGHWTVELWDAKRGKRLRRLPIPNEPSVFAPTGRDGNDADLQSDPFIRGLLRSATSRDTAVLSPDSKTISLSDSTWVRVFELATGDLVYRRLASSPYAMNVAFTPDSEVVASCSALGVELSDIRSSRTGFARSADKSARDGILTRVVDRPPSCVFTPNGRGLFITGSDGPARLMIVNRRDMSLREAAHVTSGSVSRWTVATPEGHFDVAAFDQPAPVHWAVAGTPITSLPLEVFMRDYFAPRLLTRVLAGESLPTVQDLSSVNRAQPAIDEPEVTPEGEDQRFVTVRVRVRSVTSAVQRDGQGRLRESGVYDVRLFRDGQLVRWAPQSSAAWQAKTGSPGGASDGADLEVWRRAHEIHADLPEVEEVESDGTMVVRFEHVQVPRRLDREQVEWAAYAFNEDRVKSSTAQKTEALPVDLARRPGRAYVITVGVNRTKNSPAWDLNYAANDAREVSAAVVSALEAANRSENERRQFSDVTAITLVSDGDETRASELPATKANLRAVLDALAGRPVAESMQAPLRTIDQAQPEDLIILAISSHGYTNDRGTFHFVLADVDAPQVVTPALDDMTLSTGELSAWLRSVDAGDIVMIVDACQSEATIQAEGFKPGPMGSRGLGQLAYDKGMRVLAASKARESAFEIGRDALGRDIRQGLLSYALVKDGLGRKQADVDGNGQITVGEWLAFGERAVPELFRRSYDAGGVPRSTTDKTARDGYLGVRNDTPLAYQQPTLFDFRKNGADVVLVPLTPPQNTAAGRTSEK